MISGLAILASLALGAGGVQLKRDLTIPADSRGSALYATESSALTCTSAVNGPSLEIEDAASCVMVVDVTALSGTSPTTTPRYQGSWDNTTFYAVASGAAISAVGVQAHQSTPWPRYVRVRLEPGGTVTTCTATVRYACKK